MTAEERYAKDHGFIRAHQPGVVGEQVALLPVLPVGAWKQQSQPVAEKGGQAKVVVPVTKVEAITRQPGQERTDRQGVVGRPQNGAPAGVQPPKLGADKPGIDKRGVPVGQGKIPGRPVEPPKPVVEEVVEKPKVKLRKAARPEALQLLPEATARRFTVLPINVTDNVLEVAMVNPSDLATIQILEMQSKMRIKAVAAEQKEIPEASPVDCRENLIIIGSLAAGYHFIGEDANLMVRTKDAQRETTTQDRGRETGPGGRRRALIFSSLHLKQSPNKNPPSPPLKKGGGGGI